MAPLPSKELNQHRHLHGLLADTTVPTRLLQSTHPSGIHLLPLKLLLPPLTTSIAHLEWILRHKAACSKQRASLTSRTLPPRTHSRWHNKMLLQRPLHWRGSRSASITTSSMISIVSPAVERYAVTACLCLTRRIRHMIMSDCATILDRSSKRTRILQGCAT